MYFGTDKGEIGSFNDKYLDNGESINVMWDTPFLDLGTNQYAKTIKNVLLILNPKESTGITFSYELADG